MKIPAIINELARLLIQAHDMSERTDCTQVKLLVELAMFELGKLIAQQSFAVRNRFDEDAD